MPESELTEKSAADTIEPGRPSAENVAFVLLGMASTLAVIVHIVSIFTGS